MRTTTRRLRDEGWDVHAADVLDAEPRDMLLRTHDQVRALTHALRLRLLTSLAHRPASAKQLADRFGVPTTRLYHHLDLLEEHGFVEVVATRRSGARTERCYGTPPRRSIRPGPELLDPDDRDELAAAMSSMVEIAGIGLAEAIRAGRVDLHDDDEDQPSVLVWSQVHLTTDQQRRFAAELQATVRDMIATGVDNDDVDPQDADDLEPVQLLIVQTPDVMSPPMSPDR